MSSGAGLNADQTFGHGARAPRQLRARQLEAQGDCAALVKADQVKDVFAADQCWADLCDFRGSASWSNKAIWFSCFVALKGTGQRLWLAPFPQDVETWLAGLRIGNAWQQAYLLSTISVDLAELKGDVELLALLEWCEQGIKAEPALGVYWRKRHQLEEGLKQQRTGRLT